jgi:hypothetical protein
LTAQQGPGIRKALVHAVSAQFPLKKEASMARALRIFCGSSVLILVAALSGAGSRLVAGGPDGGGEVPGLPCGFECFEQAAAAAAECRENDGSFFDCFQVYVDALNACREAAGCDGGEPPDPPEPPGICGLECFASAGEASAQCRADGGSFWDCLMAYWNSLRECRDAAGCEGPELPDLPRPCGIECFGTARDAATGCLENGGSREECVRTYLDALAACREEAGCDDPEPPQPPDLPEPCGIECFESARDAILACRENGGGFAECIEAFHAELAACREAAGCGGDEDGDDVVQALLASVEDFLRGDVNSDAGVDISDPIALLNHLFLGATVPACLDAADANDDGSLDVSDPAAILNRLFRGGEELPPPSAARGIDPTPDDLDCAGN